MSIRTLVVALGALALVGCSDDSGNPGNPDADGGTGVPDTGQPPPDGTTPATDGTPAKQCDCTADQICNTEGKCVAKPQPATGQIYGELILLRQHNPNAANSVLVEVGKAEVLLADWEPLPQDNRTHWTTQDEGGDCAYEIDTTYPYYYDNKSWPSGDGLGAGLITFKPQGAPAPGEIQMEPLDLSPGWAYFHGDIPPALKEGYGKFPDFFAPANVPFGAPFSVDLAGGPDIGTMSFAGGETAKDFTITSPAVQQAGAKAPADTPLKITWSPAQPGAIMEIFITQNWGVGGATLLTCKVPDDGETTIRAPALGNFLGEVGVQLRRSVWRYKQSKTGTGKPMHVYLIGRMARIGKLTLEKTP